MKKLFTQSIIKPPEPDGGIRISVMSRMTANNGLTPLEGVSFDEWRKDFAPSGKLVGAYYRGEVSWEEFEKRYLDFLRSDEMKPEIEAFAKRCANETITLMCIEDTPEKCHRRLLAEELQKYQPQLKIVHK
jgi:uncharacterized protein YeaO (DUF488 family)